MMGRAAGHGEPTTTPDAARGRWLPGLWLIWAAIVALALGLFVVSAAIHIRQIAAGGEPADVAPTPPALSAAAYAASVTGFGAAFAVGCFAVGAAVAWRKRRDGMVLFVALFLILLGAGNVPGMVAVEERYPALALPARFLVALVYTTGTLFLFLFPNGRFAPRWLADPALFLSVGFQVVFLPAQLSFTAPPPGFAPLALAGLGGGMLAQLYRYRRVSAPSQRQQTKWAVFGATIAVAGQLLSLLPQLVTIAFFPSLTSSMRHGTAYDLVVSGAGGYVTLFAFPVSIAVAVLRYRLWDIDRLISRALVYGALTGALAITYLGNVVVLQWLAGVLTGGKDRSQFAIVASTLAGAALFQPLRRWLQAAIDRRFFHRRYDAQRTLATFSARLRDETDLGRLSGDLLATVEEAMQPSHVSLWLRPAGGASRPGETSTGEGAR